MSASVIQRWTCAEFLQLQTSRVDLPRELLRFSIQLVVCRHWESFGYCEPSDRERFLHAFLQTFHGLGLAGGFQVGLKQ